jgi:WD40-like Beta Propeller Repeat
LGALAYEVDGDIYVGESDGANRFGSRMAAPRRHGQPFDPSRDCGVSEFRGEYSDPIWSPDGRYLAYRHTDCEASRYDGSLEWWDVVISDWDGNVVASFPSEGWRTSWSPDSTRVAVWVSWAGKQIGVYGLDGERPGANHRAALVESGQRRRRPGVVAGRRVAPAPQRRGDPPRRKHTTQTPVG